jgi:hypothetical protein
VQIDIQENFFWRFRFGHRLADVLLAPTMGGMLSAFAANILMTQAR